MLSKEHLKLLVQAVSIVAALHFAKGSMTGEYRNLMAVGLVVVVLVVVNHLLSEYEGYEIMGSAGGMWANQQDEIGTSEEGFLGIKKGSNIFWNTVF